MTDLARRILLTGVGAIFMTEESVRKTLGDLKVPTEAMGGFLDTVRKQKDELVGVFATEVGKFLSRINLHEELQKALRGMEVQLDAKVTFDKRGEPAKTKITFHRKP